MAIIICPYRANNPSHIQTTCSRQSCPLWHEPLEMCSHKATALFLYDIHQVMMRIGEAHGFIKLPEEDGLE